MSFDLQVKMFTEQITELIEQAKDEASLEFQTERSNWEQTAREYEGEIAGLRTEADHLSGRLIAAEARYDALREKLAGLV